MKWFKRKSQMPTVPPTPTVPPGQSEKVLQEFFCTKSGGGCGGYILVKLNMALNGVVEVVCPNCGHKHQRKIKDGHLIEEGRRGSPIEILKPTKAAWSATSQLRSPPAARKERDAVRVNGLADLFLEELKFEIHGDKR